MALIARALQPGTYRKCVHDRISHVLAVCRISTTPDVQLEPQPDWNVAIKEAEQVVGYPTSFLNLRWLLNDEVANMAKHLKSLVGTEHPLIKVAKNILFNNSTPAWGLVVLLISKAAGINSSVKEIECDKNAGILHSQRVLAEVTEMIRTSVLIHKGLLNIDEHTGNAEDMYYGNKIALLIGDYLLSKSFRDLAGLRNNSVNSIISSTLRDFSECEFLGQRDRQNLPIPTRPDNSKSSATVIDGDKIDYGPYKVNEFLGNPRQEWILRSLLGGANLLGKSCTSALILGGHDSELQTQAYLFGRHLALAWQAKSDYEGFMSEKNGVHLTSAPVMLHLEKHADFYEEIERGVANVEECDYKRIVDVVRSGTALEETKDLQRGFVDEALKNIHHFGESKARSALENILNTM